MFTDDIDDDVLKCVSLSEREKGLMQRVSFFFLSLCGRNARRVCHSLSLSVRGVVHEKKVQIAFDFRVTVFFFFFLHFSLRAFLLTKKTIIRKMVPKREDESATCVVALVSFKPWQRTCFYARDRPIRARISWKISSVTDTLGNEMKTIGRKNVKRHLTGITSTLKISLRHNTTDRTRTSFVPTVVLKGGLSGLNYETFMKVAEIGGFAVNWTLHRDVSGDPRNLHGIGFEFYE